MARSGCVAQSCLKLSKPPGLAYQVLSLQFVPPTNSMCPQRIALSSVALPQPSCHSDTWLGALILTRAIEKRGTTIFKNIVGNCFVFIEVKMLELQ